MFPQDMTAIKTADWRKLPLSLAELCIDTTLRCGQSFRWRKINDEWHCTLHGRLVSLKQDSDHLHYRVTWPKTTTPPGPAADDTEDLLRNYFNLHHNLTDLYQQWAAHDANFRKRAPEFTGVRILNQDVWEALVAFICSSNNNIARISLMVHNLCLHYGPYIATVADQPFHDFPDPESLTAPTVESQLRLLGFGYRAKYIAQTARTISNDRPAGWLLSLRNPATRAWGAAAPPDPSQAGQPTYKDAHQQLLQLCGVGPKVADCVSLMGLGWGEAVPVDTHVWQIAMRDYKFGAKSKTKTLTKPMYDAVGDHFRNLWGDQAGWAHSVLFTADLKTFSGRAAKKLQEDVKDVTLIKTEASEQVTLVTPRSTPTKRGRPIKTDDVKVEGEEPLDSIPTLRTSKRRRTRTQGGGS